MIVSTTAVDPVISQLTYKSRKVIEIAVILNVKLADKDDDKSSVDTQTELIHATAIAGFVGEAETDDGNLELFQNETGANWRALYLLVRQRVQSFLSMTSLRHLNLPWEPSDIKDEPEAPSLKKPRAKGSQKPKSR